MCNEPSGGRGAIIVWWSVVAREDNVDTPFLIFVLPWIKHLFDLFLLQHRTLSVAL
jgi:hypothetical protein